MFRIVFARKAARTLQKLPTDRARLIRGKIRVLATDPQALTRNVAPLKGMPDCFRLRIGDWRVIYRVKDEILDVLEIVPRESAYK